MIAYVDDAGDEGTRGSGTRWLVFGCAMVADADVTRVRKTAEVAGILVGRGKPKWLHFRDLRHDDRLGAIGFLCDSQPWQGIIIATDTTQVRAESVLRQPSYQYNYAARYVVERVSRRAEELGEEATIYFEERRNFNLLAFRRYIDLLLARRDSRLNPTCISSARIFQMPKGKDPLLCIADGLEHAGFRALEPHRFWGTHEGAYLNAFLPRIWRGPTGEANIHKWGFVLMPTDLWGGQFIREYPWIRDLPRT